MSRRTARGAAAGLLLVGIALGAAHAWAGWVLDEERKGLDESGKPVRQHVMLQTNRMKRVMLGTDGTPAHAFILDLDAETITQVDSEGRRYMTGTLQDFVQMTADAMKMAQEGQGRRPWA